MYLSNLWVTPAIWGNYVQDMEKLMKGSQEAEMPAENRALVDLLIIKLEGTPKEGSCSDNWPVIFE
jgi:hypothetical protein